MFDVVRSAPLMQDMFNEVASEEGFPQKPPRTSLPCDGDLLEILDVPLKQAWNGCVMRARKVHPGTADSPTFIEGELVTPNGEIAQACSVFKGEVTINKQNKHGNSYYSVRHPAAKLILERAAGSKWINCKQGAKRARDEAEEVKREWEAEFAKRIDKIVHMRICLCTHTPCSHQSDDMAMHVASWNLLPKGTFGNIVIGAVEAKGSGASTAERLVRQRTNTNNRGARTIDAPNDETKSK